MFVWEMYFQDVVEKDISIRAIELQAILRGWVHVTRGAVEDPPVQLLSSRGMLLQY
jgi:hypothetical protein